MRPLRFPRWSRSSGPEELFSGRFQPCSTSHRPDSTSRYLQDLWERGHSGNRWFRSPYRFQKSDLRPAWPPARSAQVWRRYVSRSGRSVFRARYPWGFRWTRIWSHGQSLQDGWEALCSCAALRSRSSCGAGSSSVWGRSFLLRLPSAGTCSFCNVPSDRMWRRG